MIVDEVASAASAAASAAAIAALCGCADLQRGFSWSVQCVELQSGVRGVRSRNAHLTEQATSTGSGERGARRARGGSSSCCSVRSQSRRGSVWSVHGDHATRGWRGRGGWRMSTRLQRLTHVREGDRERPRAKRVAARAPRPRFKSAREHIKSTAIQRESIDWNRSGVVDVSGNE